MTRTRWRFAAGPLLVAVGTALAVGPSPARAGLTPLSLSPIPSGISPLVGMQDDRILFAPDPAARVRLMADAGAAVIRVDLRWDQVSTRRPVNAADPADAAYDWHRYDQIVSAAAANRVSVLFAVYGTPGWAADPSVPPDPRYPAFSVRPLDASDFGAFGEAAARRYAPRGVRRWEGGNEPNIPLFLRPQYERVGGRWVAVSPSIYSALQKEFYAGVKRADAKAVVAGAVTAPAGDRCPECPVDAPPLRVPPDDFIRALGGAGRRPPMDAVSHHPYPITAPRRYTPPARTYVDLYNLDVLVRAIDSTYLKGKRLWLTEYGFATSRVAQYPTFFSRGQQASFIVDAFRRMRANRRVALATYYLLQDHEEWASGVLTIGGAKKPGYRGFALPLASSASGRVRSGTRVVLTGQVRSARGRSAVVIERRLGTRWIRARVLRTARDGSFAFVVRPRAAVTLRARWSGRSRSGARVTRISPAVAIRLR